MNITKKAFLITVFAAGSIFACEEAPNDLKNPSAELKTTFGVIQGIHKLAARVAKEAAEQNDSKVTLGTEGWPGSNPCWNQTRQGLFLRAEQYPSSLDSPWGKVMIYGGGWFRDGFSAGSLFCPFRANMRLKFVRNTCEKGGQYSTDVIKFYRETYQSPISREDLEKYRGTDTKILANYCGCESIYEIESFQGTALPKAEPLTKWKNYRESDDVEKSWNELVKSKIKTLDQESR